MKPFLTKVGTYTKSWEIIKILPLFEARCTCSCNAYLLNDFLISSRPCASTYTPSM